MLIGLPLTIIICVKCGCCPKGGKKYHDFSDAEDAAQYDAENGIEG